MVMLGNICNTFEKKGILRFFIKQDVRIGFPETDGLSSILLSYRIQRCLL